MGALAVGVWGVSAEQNNSRAKREMEKSKGSRFAGLPWSKSTSGDYIVMMKAIVSGEYRARARVSGADGRGARADGYSFLALRALG